MTRDIRYALRWKDVTFVLNASKLRNRYKIIPYAWNYHLRDTLNYLPNHKKEREEFVIIKDTLDDYQKNGQLDYDRFMGPEGSIPNLDSFLMGIMVPHDEFLNQYPEISQHPRFLGINK